jgi:hypothetical protein
MLANSHLRSYENPVGSNVESLDETGKEVYLFKHHPLR